MQSTCNQADPLEVLVRVAHSHGVDLTAEALRQAYVHTPDAIDSPMLLAIAREAGLEAKSIYPQWHQLPRLENVLPAIIRLKDGGYAVLASVVTNPQIGQAVLLEDMENGAITEVALDETQLDELWSGEVILIKRRHSVTDEAQPFGFSWILGQVLRERRLFREIAIASVIMTILAIAPAMIAMIVIDRVLVNHSVSTLIILTGVVTFIVLSEMAFGFFRRKFTEVAATRIDARLNLYMMEKLLSLPMEYFENNPTGLTMSKLGKVWQIRSFFTGTLLQTFIDFVMIVLLVPVLFLLQWRLALFVLSWSFIEAMSAGCAIVGSDTPPVMEVLRDEENGLAVDFFSPTEIADRVDQILDHPTRMQHIRDAARQTAVSEYDFRSVLLPRWLSLIDDMVNGRKPKREFP